MNLSRFDPYSNNNDRPSRLVLFPHTSYERFCDGEWVGREVEWLRLANILHWTLSYLGDTQRASVLLLQPDSEHIAENLATHVPRDQIREISVPVDTSSNPQLADLHLLRDRLEAIDAASLDLILATGLFSRGASSADEEALLRTCHSALKPGGRLLATFPLQDGLGNAVTARNMQFFDATVRARFQQVEILGCQGIAEFLDRGFWEKLRLQGFAAFDAVFNALGPLTDSPAALWMSSEALYIGQKG